MLSSISWPQFLIFLAVVVSLYYASLWLRWSFRKKQTSPVDESSRENPREPVHVATAAKESDGFSTSELPLLIPTGLLHEVSSHLQQLASLGLPRKELLESVHPLIRKYDSEKVDLGRIAFVQQLNRTFFTTSSITLTDDEAQAFWDNHPSSTIIPLQS